jgi:hypothetical protein
MTHRWPSRLTLTCLALALLGLVARHASGAVIQKTFRLSNQGTSSVSRIDLNVVPPGAVVPPTVETNGQPVEGSPLLILPESSGFDENHFSVALGNKPGSQLLRLLFGQTQSVDSNGEVVFVPTTGPDGQAVGLFEPGGALNFALTIEDSAANALMLQLPEPAGGLVLQSWPLGEVDVTPEPPTDGSPTGPATPTPEPSQIPEPLPVMLWGGLFALGFFKLRGLRRPTAA